MLVALSLFRRPLCLTQNCQKVLTAFSQTHKEIRHVAAFSYFCRQLNNICAWNEFRYTERTALAGFVVIKADVNVRNRFKFLCPLFFEGFRAAGGGYGFKAV